MTESFRYIDDEDNRLSAEPSLRLGAAGYTVRISSASGNRVRNVAVWLTPDAAACLAATLAEPTVEQLLPSTTYEPVPRAEITLGAFSIVVEGTSGDIPMDVAKALVKVLKNADPRQGAEASEQAETIVADLCEALACERVQLIAAVEDLQREAVEHTRERGQLAAKIAQIEHSAADSDRGWSAARKRIAELDARLRDEREGLGALRTALREAGLVSMSTAPPAELAESVAGLGSEINDLRGRLDKAGGFKHEAKIKELQEEIEAGRVVAEELSKGLQREREIHAETRRLLDAETERHATARNGRKHVLQRIGAARSIIMTAASDLTTHAAPDDELDVRVLDRLMTAIDALGHER